MKIRDWFLFAAAMIVMALAYSDAQHRDEQSAMRDIAAVARSDP